jgi:general secretion pathway protein D
VLAALAVVALAGCARFPEARLELATPDRTVRPDREVVAPAAVTQADVDDSGPTATGFYAPGSDRFVSRSAAKPTPAPVPARGAGVTLNFENTSVLEVVKVVLGDLLGRSYTIEPGVQGTVTLQSSSPIAREALLPTLELLLRMNGAALVDAGGGLLRVVPQEKALRGSVSPQLGDTRAPLPRGYGVRVVPLRFVSAAEMRNILEPMVDPGALVRIDSRRNLLIVAGNGEQLAQLRDAVELFDVDWMTGMSVALFRPDFVSAEALAEELGAVLGTGAEGPLNGLVRFVVIERLNGLLVVTPRREYLARVREWIARLDQSGGGMDRRLFVYHVQNGKAVELADVLAQVFQREAELVLPPAEVAPGLQAREIGSGAELTAPGAPESGAAPRALADTPADAVPAAGAGVAISPSSEVKIIADEVNNALLILANGIEYKRVEAAIRQLDLAPLQVLIEATIAEVRLEDQLSQGLEWFFKNNFDNKKGTGTLDLNDTLDLAALLPGFSYAITDNAGLVRAVLNTLATESRAKIISSPSLMVLNNQQATIQVGDQVPITTQQQQATTENANLVNNIEFRDTGVLLSVTPRVNAGGLVIMEVEQEVSNVAPTADETLTPTIQQRKINSTVAVQSGETVVLGGLIRENDNRTGTGVPGLRDIPVLGWFFGASTDELTRSELVVLITPRAVRGKVQAREVTEEFREKMDSLKPGRAPPRGFGPFYHETYRLHGKTRPEPGAAGSPATATATASRQQSEHGLRMASVLDPGRPSRPLATGPEPATRAPVPLALTFAHARRDAEESP